MDQRRRNMRGGPGPNYQNGPRQQDANGMYGQFGPVRGHGRPNGPGNSRNGDRMQSHGSDSLMNSSMKEKELALSENRIFPLERPSPMFPNAKWFCRLCHQHFNQMNTALDHCSIRVHARKKAALDLRKVVLAMPRALEESHKVALEKELMNVYNTQKMTEENLEVREKVVNEVSTYLQENLKKSDLKVDEKFLDFKLLLQGSSLSKLGLKSSDINMDLHLCQVAPADVQAKIYFEILRILEQWSDLTDFDAQLNLTIPMVKAFHKPSNFPIEILFGGVAPLKTNRLLHDYADMDERLAPLAVNFRYWAKQCSLDDPHKGFLPAHSFAIMTVFYLQQISPPVLPCIHDSMKDTEDDDYKRPEEPNDWKSENTLSVAELWLGMLRFYAAEFPVKKLCISIRTRKKSFLTQRRWPSRFIGIEDPYCRKKSLAKCIVSDLVMPYLLMCLRASYIYFAVPRSGERGPLFDFPAQLKLDDVEDPEGDDIEDGLAADEEVPENEDEQEQDEEQDTAPGAEAPEIEVMIDLRGWNQSWPENIQTQIKECETLQYTMDNVGALTGKSSAPVVCISCRQAGHRANSCPEAKLPEVAAASSHAFSDAQGIHSELCQYIYENFRPTISEEELSARVKIVQDIEAFIQRTMPEAYLTLFGSSRNGFSLEKADLDICLKYKNKKGIDESMDVKDIIVGISRILEEHPDISEVQAIASAKVPIVKFHHDPFGVDGDISLYNVLAEHNTAMLKAYSLIDERVVHLGAAFKQYVKLCDMGDASRGSLSSYAYIVMLIHYLQKENIVPVLQALPPIGHPPGEELPKVMIDGWNAYYFKDIDRLGEVWPLLGSNKKSVGELWLGLIDYYATKFRFDHHVVCIRQLEPLSRLEKMWTNKPLCVEDPFELDHNLGTGISAKMAKYIFSALITSRNWFIRTPERSFPDPTAIYKHFMNLRELAVGKPPKDRGCKRCGKIGHWIKACPFKQGEAADKKSNRRVCHSCGKPGHIVKDCPTRLKQIRTPKERPVQQQQHHMQYQDNRFPLKAFPSQAQIPSPIAQNDMTNPFGNNYVARGDGPGACMLGNKTVSEELENRRKKKNKNASKKMLHEGAQREAAPTAPPEEPVTDAPSVRKKTKGLQQGPPQEYGEQCLQTTLTPKERYLQKKERRIRRKEMESMLSKERGHEPETRESEITAESLFHAEDRESDQAQIVAEVVENVLDAVCQPSGSAIVFSEEPKQNAETFEFRFDIPDDARDGEQKSESVQKPDGSSKFGSKPRQTAKQTTKGAEQSGRKDSPANATPTVDKGARAISKNDRKVQEPKRGKLRYSEQRNIAIAAFAFVQEGVSERENPNPKISEKDTRGLRGKGELKKVPPSEWPGKHAGQSETLETGQGLSSEIRDRKNSSEVGNRNNSSENRDRKDSTKIGDRKNSSSSTRDLGAISGDEKRISDGAKRPSKASRNKLKRAQKRREQKALRKASQNQEQGTSSSAAAELPGSNEEQETKQHEAASAEPPGRAPESQFPEVKSDEGHRDVGEKDVFGVETVSGSEEGISNNNKQTLREESRAEVSVEPRHHLEDEAGNGRESEEPKPEKSRKARKKARNKSIRNAEKKRERAAALNNASEGNEQFIAESTEAPPTDAAAHETSPKSPNHPVVEEKSRNDGFVEVSSALEVENPVRSEPQRKKARSLDERSTGSENRDEQNNSNP